MGAPSRPRKPFIGPCARIPEPRASSQKDSQRAASRSREPLPPGVRRVRPRQRIGPDDRLRVVGLSVLWVLTLRDDLDASAELAHCIVQHLAVLVGQNRDDLVGVSFEQTLEPEQNLRTLDRWRVAPGRICGRRRRDRCVVEHEGLEAVEEGGVVAAAERGQGQRQRPASTCH